MVRSGGREIDLAAATAVYPRPHDTRRLAALDRSRPNRAWAGAIAFDQGMVAWLELTSALVVNRPSAMSVNGSKPLQSLEIQAAGFSVPETLVTTDAEAALAFWRRHRRVVYKSVSGVRSQVARLRPAHASRLTDLAWCPTQFQRYIAGREFRAHVVGDAVFACEIVSDADDYRHPDDGRSPDIVSAELPPEVAARCAQMTRTMGLHVAGIDLRLSDDGAWYCLEANPSPGFTFYEEATGQPIAAAVARLLCGRKGRTGRQATDEVSRDGSRSRQTVIRRGETTPPPGSALRCGLDAAMSPSWA